VAKDPIEKPSCLMTCAEPDGRLLVLVVMTDGEGFYSYITRFTDLDTGAREVVYEAPVWLTSMAISPTGTIYAVDADGSVHTDATGTFVATDTHSDSGFTRVWCLDDDNVFACGNRGVMVRKKGRQWAQFNSGLDGDLYGVHGTGVADLYTVGEEGRTFHYDGRAWVRIEPFTNYLLNSVLCVSPKSVYVCGMNGALFHGSQARWRQLEAPPVTYHSLAQWRGTVYVAAGGAGVFVVEGNVVNSFQKGLTLYKLLGSDDFLLGAGGDLCAYFDGQSWSGNRFG
jgi:hypothetical protein